MVDELRQGVLSLASLRRRREQHRVPLFGHLLQERKGDVGDAVATLTPLCDQLVGNKVARQVDDGEIGDVFSLAPLSLVAGRAYASREGKGR